MEAERLAEIVKRMGRFVAGRDRCRFEVESYLARKKLCERADYPHVLAFLEEKGFVDEERFARNRVEYRLGQGYGPRYLSQEFRQLKIPDELARTALDLDEDEILEAARAALTRKRRQLTANGTPDDLNDRLVRYLQTRGFEYAQIKKLLSGGLELIE